MVEAAALGLMLLSDQLGGPEQLVQVKVKVLLGDVSLVEVWNRPYLGQI